eukprot:Skav228405  [mRNA]  locus=scaffold3824:107632:111723:- [translate_table: standard]
MTGSFPCKSWSSASWQRGLNDPNGHTLIEGLMHARITRPRLLVLENVMAIEKHPHYPIVLQLIHHAGYRVLKTQIVNASDRLPVKRTRWLALLQRYEETPTTLPWEHWAPNHSTPLTWDILEPTPEARLKKLQVPSEVLEQYLEPKYLPKHVDEAERRDPLLYRLPKLTKKLPTILSMYTQQHCLPEELLEEKGLLGHFVKEKNIIRWFKPTEIAYMHCLPDCLVLPFPPEAIYQHLGNCIVPHHAVLMLVNMHSFVHPDESFPKLAECIQKLEETRFRASQHQVISDELAIYMGTKLDCEQQRRSFQLLMTAFDWHGDYQPRFPETSFFHPLKGKCSFDSLEPDPHMQIPRTLPFTIDQMAAQQQQIDDAAMSPDRIHTTFIDSVDQSQHASDEEMLDTSSNTDEWEPMLITNNRFVPVQIQTHRNQGTEIQVHDAVQWGLLLSLWDFQIQPCQGPTNLIGQVTNTLFMHDCVHESTLVPQLKSDVELIPSTYDDRVLLLASTDEHTFVIAVDKGTTWQAVQTQYPEIASCCFDEAGPLRPDDAFYGSKRLFSKGNSVELPIWIEGFQMAIRKVHYHIQLSENQLLVEFTGTTDQLAAVLMLWQLAFHTDWQHKHGVTTRLRSVDPNTCQMIFRPQHTKFNTPLHMIQNVLHIRLFQTAIMTMTGTSPQHVLRFKLNTRCIAQVPVDDHMSFGQVHAILEHCFHAQQPGCSPRMICFGKRLEHMLQVCDIKKPTGYNKSELNIHFVYPLRGGGPADGNRREHTQAVRASVATMLLSNGLHLDKVPMATQTLIKQYGLPQLQDVAYNHGQDDTKVEQFRRMCSNADIVFPNQTNEQIKHAKFAQQTHDRSMKQAKNIDVTKYQLQQGFFLNADKSAASIHTQFSPHKPGVTMLSPKEATTWIHQPMSLSPDEVAIFVVGEAKLTQHPKAQRLVAPAFNSSGHRVLLGGVLIQLGEKSIQHIGDLDEDAKLESRETQICSVTLWQTDFTPSEWQQCYTSPVRFAKQLLAQDRMEHAIRNPFGRAFRKGSQPCQPKDATSVQFHTEIWVQDLKQLLRLSGWNKVFLTPKDHDGRPSSFWKPVWTDVPKSTLEAKTASLAGMAGYIRGNRMCGVRVELTNFAACWTALKPEQPVPQLHKAAHVWKVQPFPWGMDKDIIQEWLDKNSWKASPLKSIGARAWLISSDEQPPPGILRFNEHPLLVTETQSRSKDAQIGLVAGPRSRDGPGSSSNEAPPNAFRLGDPHMDPWAKPANATPVTQGASSQRFDHQEQRIDTLEKSLRQIQEQCQQQSADTNTRFAALDQNLQQHAQQTQNAFQTLRQDFKNTLHQALSQQDQRYATTMDEIKQLLLRAEKRKQPDSDSEDLG